MFRVTVPALKYIMIRSLFCSAGVSTHTDSLCVRRKLGGMGQVSRSGLALFLKLCAQELILMSLSYLHTLRLC